MVSLDDAVVARLGRFGTTFEILVDPDAAEAFIEVAHTHGGDKADEMDVAEVLAVEDIFVDWSEGERASQEQLQKAFETLDVSTIARRILDEGEIQLTQEQRKKMLDQKHKRIVDTIVRNAWDPKAKAPHPRERIERALEEGKFRTDPLRPVQEQVKNAIATLRPLLPIAFEKVRIAIRVPAEHAGKAYSHIRSLGDPQKEEWQNDGSVVVILEIPAGVQGELYDSLNSMTHGDVETKLLE